MCFLIGSVLHTTKYSVLCVEPPYDSEEIYFFQSQHHIGCLKVFNRLCFLGSTNISYLKP